jgi:hypothetical protein
MCVDSAADCAGQVVKISAGVLAVIAGTAGIAFAAAPSVAALAAIAAGLGLDASIVGTNSC